MKKLEERSVVYSMFKSADRCSSSSSRMERIGHEST
jgi:hypothetical protein